MYNQTLNKIIFALSRQGRAESIQKFANTQNILKNFGYKNILLLTRQAHVNQMSLEDVRTENEWKQLNISPSHFSKKLALYYGKELPSGEIIVNERVGYDISHTDAIIKGIIPRETFGKVENNDFQILFNNLLPYIKQQFNTITVNENENSNLYLAYSESIALNNTGDPLEKINFLINAIYTESIYGDKIRGHGFFQKEEPLDLAIAKIITNSYLNRLSIQPEQVGNDLTFEESQALFLNLEESLKTISNNIKEFDKKFQISSFINEHFNVYNKVIEHKNEIDNKIESIKEKKKWIEFIKFKDDEKKEMSKRTRDEIIVQDPASVINALGLNVSKSKPNEITFKARVEKTASATIKLVNGSWLYNDFGGGKGTVINLVQDVLNVDFKEAIQFCIDTLGTNDYYQMRYEEIEQENEFLKMEAGHTKPIHANSKTKPKSKTTQEILEEKSQELQALKDANLELEKKHSTNSKVTYASKSIPPYLIKWLKEERGISNIEIKNFYFIKGEAWKVDENGNPCDIKKKEGVGVLCADKEMLIEINSKIEENGFASFNFPYSDEQTVGADVHFPPYTFMLENGDEVTMKTQSFGNKKNSTFLDFKGDTIAPIESKMDYAAAYQQLNFQNMKIDVDIANSTSNADIIGKNIADKSYQNVLFLNQFDLAGVKFLIDIHDNAKANGHEIKNFKYMDYAQNEYKQDINDLHKNHIDLQSRVKEGTLVDLNKLLDKIALNEKGTEKMKDIKSVREMLQDSIMETKEVQPNKAHASIK